MNLNTDVMQFLWEERQSFNNPLVYCSQKLPHQTRWRKCPYVIYKAVNRDDGIVK